METTIAPDHGDDEPFIPVERVFARYKVRPRLANELTLRSLTVARGGLVTANYVGVAKSADVLSQISVALVDMGKAVAEGTAAMERLRDVFVANVDDGDPGDETEAGT